MKMKKLLSLGTAFIVAGSLLVGCTSTNSTESQENSSTEQTTEANASYKDGTYKATYSHIDSHGWRPIIEITIKGGKIEKAMMDYVNPEGKLKSQDEEYAKNMKAKSGTAPADAYDKLNEDLVAKQDVTKVDSVSGATHSSEFFKELATSALDKAKSGDTAEVILPMNDTYTAEEADFDDHGWKSQIAITYKDGKITEVLYNEVNKDGKIKKEDNEYNEKMRAKSGITAKESQEKLEKALVENQDVEKVDSVSGATSTSDKFVKLAKEAIAKRVEYKK